MGLHDDRYNEGKQRATKENDSVEIYFFVVVKQQLSEEMIFKGNLKEQRKPCLVKETMVGKGFMCLGTETRVAELEFGDRFHLIDSQLD